MLFRYLTWAFEDRYFDAGIDLINHRLDGATLAHRDLLWNAVGLHGPGKETHGCGFVAPGRQQEVDRLVFFIHSTVKIFPGAFDQDAGLIDAPTAANRALVLAEHFLKGCTPE